MRTLKSWFIASLFVLSAAIGVYCGVWWAFVGGVCQVVEGIGLTQAHGLDGVDIGLGLLRIFFSVWIGVGSFLFCGLCATWFAEKIGA